METIIKKAIEGGWSEHFGDKKVRMIWNDKSGWWYEWDSEDEYGNPIALSNPCCYDHIKYQYPLVLNSDFWKALGRVCGWGNKKVLGSYGVAERDTWLHYAQFFHETNLTEGWNKAVTWLESIINVSDNEKK